MKIYKMCPILLSFIVTPTPMLLSDMMKNKHILDCLDKNRLPLTHIFQFPLESAAFD